MHRVSVISNTENVCRYMCVYKGKGVWAFLLPPTHSLLVYCQKRDLGQKRKKVGQGVEHVTNRQNFEEEGPLHLSNIFPGL